MMEQTSMPVMPSHRQTTSAQRFLSPRLPALRSHKPTQLAKSYVMHNVLHNDTPAVIDIVELQS
jgi:hypothetical protein